MKVAEKKGNTSNTNSSFNLTLLSILPLISSSKSAGLQSLGPNVDLCARVSLQQGAPRLLATEQWTVRLLRVD
jgi:hypothetical protein